MHREERTMTTIYLIRHAEAEGNVFRRIHGQYDSCVTPNGRRQIAALAQRFAGIPVDAVYASDLKRTCLTATAIYRQKGLPAPPRRALPRGRPRPVGGHAVWRVGATLSRAAARLLSRFLPLVCGGRGVLPAICTPLPCRLDDVVRRHEGQSIAIFSHGMVLRGALIELFFPGQDEGVSHSENTAVTELHWENGSYELVSLNDATHLTPELSTLGRQNWWRGSRYLDFNMWYRDAAPEDAPLLAALGCPQTEPGDRVRIAMLRDTPAGMVATRRLDGDEGALLHLALLPEHRGCGLAAQLLGEAICPLRAGGAKHLRLLRPVTDKGTKRLLATYGITDGCSIVPTEE